MIIYMLYNFILNIILNYKLFNIFLIYLFSIKIIILVAYFLVDNLLYFHSNWDKYINFGSNQIYIVSINYSNLSKKINSLMYFLTTLHYIILLYKIK